MTSQPPYVAIVERLCGQIAATRTEAEIEALKRTPEFAEAFKALPLRGQQEVARAGREHRKIFTLGAG